MSLTGKSLNRFRSRVDDTLDDAFPVSLIIAGQIVAAAGPGGRAVTQYFDGGENENFRLPFRIKKSQVPSGWEPIVGASLDWKISATETIPLEIQEAPIRPHEDRFAFVCRKRKI